MVQIYAKCAVFEAFLGPRGQKGLFRDLSGPQRADKKGPRHPGGAVQQEI